MAKGYQYEERDRRGATLLRGVWAITNRQRSLLRVLDDHIFWRTRLLKDAGESIVLVPRTVRLIAQQRI